MKEWFAGLAQRERRLVIALAGMMMIAIVIANNIWGSKKEGGFVP